MKIVGIYRGFPGLGRVVAGVELVDYFRINHNADVLLFSYLQGELYLKQKGYDNVFDVKKQDYSSIGIIPIGRYGEFIINQIENFKPDLIVLDGEPLMTQCLKLVFPTIKLICLLNPFDVENPYNQPSSSKFLNYAYSNADLSIVHGLWKVKGNNNYNNLQSINTIVRTDVLSIKRNHLKNKISCILGGGTVNANSQFIRNSLDIAEKCVQLAKYILDYEIHIFCSCEDIIVNNVSKLSNVFIHKHIENCEQYYSDSRIIICRAGRNTISELLCLGIPSIVIPSGDNFRAKEQLINAERAEITGNGLIRIVPQDADINHIIQICHILTSIQEDSRLQAGNNEAIRLMLQLYKFNKK